MQDTKEKLKTEELSKESLENVTGGCLVDHGRLNTKPFRPKQPFKKKIY